MPVSVQMIGLATLIILIASFNAAERERKRKLDGDDAEPRDVIGRDQAYRFPLVASCALFGMFLAFKYLPKEWVSFLLTLYGVSFGGIALANCIGPVLAALPGMPASLTKEFGLKDYLLLSMCDVVGLIIATPIAYWYYVTKDWLPNNILACALALSAVDMLAISDFKSSAVLLSGLFMYDIFWVFGSKRVFGSNVMVTVAKQFEGPIKLVFPRFLGAGPSDMSMLGLGDIVIPGLFVALMLRFDIRALPLTSPIPRRAPYFASAVCAYVAGLVATYIALTVFEAAQPALLYLVPSCLITSTTMAFANGELGELFAYTEEDEEVDDAKKKTAAEGVATEPVEVKKDQ